MKRIYAMALLSALLVLPSRAAGERAADTLTVRIEKMHCDHCAHKVKTLLKQDEGVSGVTVNLERHTVAVAYAPQKTCSDSIRARLAATGRYLPSDYDPQAVLKNSVAYRVDDMHCRKCSNRITEGLNKLGHIDSLKTSLGEHYVYVSYDANRLSKADIREAILQMGYTPVAYYQSEKVDYAYYNLPDGTVGEEAIDGLLAEEGVADVTFNAKRKALAVSYVKQTLTADKLLETVKAQGINAVVPPPHECKEKGE